MLGGGIANPNLDGALHAVALSAADKQALVSFLNELGVEYDEAEPVLPEEAKETNMSGTELRGISQIAVVVHDVARAEDFYGKTLGLRHLFSVPSRMAFFELGGVRLMLSMPEPTVSHKSSLIYFDVADIQATHKALVAKGVQFLGEPHPVGSFGGSEIWIAEFSDPDGNLLALQSAVRK
jgi:methylmalonyl-CoA/ethylmalonyl-CoA epimerase